MMKGENKLFDDWPIIKDNGNICVINFGNFDE